MGTSASYGLRTSNYYRSSSAAAQQLAASRSAVALRQQYLMREMLDAAARLEAAERAYAEGDIQLASRIFMAVARCRPSTPVTQKAKQRLGELTEEAKQKIQSVDAQLAEVANRFTTAERLGLQGPLPEPWKEAVTVAFAGYEQLCERYEAVPTMRGELKGHVAQQRRRPEHAAVLNEPKAMALLELARQHEREDQACCAFWAYQEAAQLAPAPAARTAAEQLARLQADPEVVAAAQACRQLQECHKLYNRAESLAKTWPARTQQLLTQVVQIAPPDSEIYRAAERRLQTLAAAAGSDKAPLDMSTPPTDR